MTRISTLLRVGQVHTSSYSTSRSLLSPDSQPGNQNSAENRAVRILVACWCRRTEHATYLLAAIRLVARQAMTQHRHDLSAAARQGSCHQSAAVINKVFHRPQSHSPNAFLMRTDRLALITGAAAAVVTTCERAQAKHALAGCNQARVRGYRASPKQWCTWRRPQAVALRPAPRLVVAEVRQRQPRVRPPRPPVAAGSHCPLSPEHSISDLVVYIHVLGNVCARADELAVTTVVQTQVYVTNSNQLSPSCAGTPKHV